jgi:hypothetical protein
LSIPLPRGAFADFGAAVTPVPRQKGGAFGFDLSCPEVDGYPTMCRTTVRIVARSSQRLLATGRLDDDAGSEDLDRFLRLHLTASGLAFHGDRRRQWVSVVVRGPFMVRTAWTIGF